MGEVIDENGLGRHIRYRHTDLVGALVERRQSLDARGAPGPTPAKRSGSPRISCGCARDTTGTREGYTPEWAGMEDFKGRIVHPQTWPEDLDYTGKKVVVIGSGATAATLDPGDRGRLRARHDAAALADLFQDRPQCHRDRRRAARARHRRDVDPRDRAQEDPARSGRLHPPLVHRAGGRASRSCWRRCGPIWGRTTTSRRTSRRDTGRGGSASPSFRTATSCRRSGRQGLGRHRRDRELHRDRHPAEVRQAPRGRHHHHGHRVQSQCAGRHRLRHRRQAARSSPTRSPIAA